jgi:hypothetical protein
MTPGVFIVVVLMMACAAECVNRLLGEDDEPDW